MQMCPFCGQEMKIEVSRVRGAWAFYECSECQEFSVVRGTGKFDFPKKAVTIEPIKLVPAQDFQETLQSPDKPVTQAAREIAALSGPTASAPIATPAIETAPPAFASTPSLERTEKRRFPSSAFAGARAPEATRALVRSSTRLYNEAIRRLKLLREEALKASRQAAPANSTQVAQATETVATRPASRPEAEKKAHAARARKHEPVATTTSSQRWKLFLMHGSSAFMMLICGALVVIALLLPFTLPYLRSMLVPPQPEAASAFELQSNQAQTAPSDRKPAVQGQSPAQQQAPQKEKAGL